MTKITLSLLAVALVFSLADYAYHLPEVKKINEALSGDMTLSEIYRFLGHFRAKPYDNFVGVLPMLSNVMVCIAVVTLAVTVNHLVVDLLCSLFIAGRFRSLGELGHMAIHKALTPSEKLNLFLADVFFQFPLFKPSIQLRRQRHCVEHHPNVNLRDLDTGMKDFYDIGFVPGISERFFWKCVFYPLTPPGILMRIKGCIRSVMDDFGYPIRLALRIICVSLVVLPFIYYGKYYELTMFYILPLLVFFPQFYWFSLVVEHRWFVDVSNESRLQREIISGRPTDYPGVSGFLWRTHFFPVGDSYHMVHSLFPYLRWNYLPTVDKLLKKNIPEYSEHLSAGLFLKKYESKPTAISELRDRMVRSLVVQKAPEPFVN